MWPIMGVTVASISMKAFLEMVNSFSYADSPFNSNKILIDSGSDISLVWNQDTFSCMKPFDLKQFKPGGSTPLLVQAIGMVSFNLGSYVDCHGQSHPFDLEIPNVYYVPESTMNILSTTHLKQYKIFFNSQHGRDVLIIPCLPSQVTGVWGNWHQTYGKDGYPAIHQYLGDHKPVLRTNPVDDGDVWTKVSAVVEQGRTRSERHNVNIAALNERLQRSEVTPEFLVHLAFNHCGDGVMRLMRKHSELFDLNLGSPDRVVG